VCFDYEIEPKGLKPFSTVRGVSIGLGLQNAQRRHDANHRPVNYLPISGTYDSRRFQAFLYLAG